MTTITRSRRSRRLSILVLPIVLSASLLLSACGSSAPSTGATKLHVTLTVRAQLLRSGAKDHGLVAKDYTGLYPKTLFYAVDANGNHYAAASLIPSKKSYKAEVAAQDDGGYNLFVLHAGSTVWKVYNDGLGGVKWSTCPITLPAAVVKVWGWKKGTCYPPAKDE